MSQQRKTDKPRFTSDQISQLSESGLNQAQIDELEKILPNIKVHLTSPPRLSDVRDELNALLKALSQTKSTIDTLKTNMGGIHARTEAYNRLILSSDETGSIDDYFIDDYFDLTTSWIAITQRAINDLPKEQRRKTANHFSIRRIEKALLDGFIKHHSAAQPDKALPPYDLKTSSSPNSQFRRIVGICFEAIGEKNTDPERAIKKHIRWNKHSRQKQREAMGITTQTIEK